MSLRHLICGVGSIGERHIRNLLALGHEDIILLRRADGPLRTIDQGFPSVSTLAEALDARPDTAFVCNPTHLHLETATACAEAGCHLFVEKPIAHGLDGLDRLRAAVAASGKACMVGYMLRFHPCLRQVKRWLDQGRIGTPAFALSEWGEYLPDWHPWEDYRASYSARRDMGGGPVLTLSHDIDMLLWLLGGVSAVKAMTGSNSPLELGCEHWAQLLLSFETGATAAVHLDYLQRPPRRSLAITGSDGRIAFDYYRGVATLTPAGAAEPAEIADAGAGFDRNDMFVAELRAFLDAVAGRAPVSPDLEDGVRALSVALAGLRSAEAAGTAP
ncbi:MAG: Gfo/Idh/MocA family protein [Actinomycetota bacterium]